MMLIACYMAAVAVGSISSKIVNMIMWKMNFVDVVYLKYIFGGWFLGVVTVGYLVLTFKIYKISLKYTFYK